jgi:hypothetical protein
VVEVVAVGEEEEGVGKEPDKRHLAPTKDYVR